MPGRTSSPSDPATAEAIGEIRGQLREIIHTQNNNAQRYEVQAQIISKLSSVPDDVKDIKARLNNLETEQHRREGAAGLAQAILKSPTLGWIVGALTTAWAFLTGRLHL